MMMIGFNGVNCINSTRKKLIAAVSSSICAGIWLINCILDVTLHIPAALAQDVMLTLVWMLCAVGWWWMWHASRRQADG